MDTKQVLREHLETYDNSELELSNIIEDFKIQMEHQDFIDSEGGNWASISGSRYITMDFMRYHRDKIRWKCVLSNIIPFSEDFIEEFQDRLNWIHISKYQVLSADFMRRFQNRINWYEVSRCRRLSDKFMREFQDMLYWRTISYHQKLSEDFIREFKDLIHWDPIFSSQKLSVGFIREFIDKVHYWGSLFDCQNLSEDFRLEFGYKTRS